MHNSDLVDQLRVAIALAALKVKPPAQSYAAFVLDLCDRFPLSPSLNNAGDNEPSVPLDKPWRESALVLQEELTALCTKSAKLELENLFLRSQLPRERLTPGITTPPSSSPLLPPSGLTSKKGSSKKKAPVPCPPPASVFSMRIDDAGIIGAHRETDADEVFPSLPPLQDQTQILFAIEQLDHIVSRFSSSSSTTIPTASPQNESAANLQFLSNVCSQVAKLVSNTLLEVISSPSRVGNSIDHIEHIESSTKVIRALLTRVISPLLTCIAATNLPTKTKDRGRQKGWTSSQIQLVDNALDDLLSKVAPDILLPCLQSIQRLSREYFINLFSPPSAPHKHKSSAGPIPVDIRRQLLCFLEETVRGLGALDLKYNGRLVTKRRQINELLVLEGVRIISSLYASIPGPHTVTEANPEALSNPSQPAVNSNPLSATLSVEPPAGQNCRQAAALFRLSCRSQEDRIHARADSETFAYICQIIHASLPSSNTFNEERDPRLLQRAIQTFLSDLVSKSWRLHIVSSTVSPFAAADWTKEEENEEARGSVLLKRLGELGPVEAGMILAIAEKVWLMDGLAKADEEVDVLSLMDSEAPGTKNTSGV